MTRAALYARQSESRGAGDDSLSIESQLAELRRRAEREGWHVVAELRDADLKGWMDETERPGLAAVLDLAEQRKVDTVLVWKLDRLARSVRLQEYWVWQLARHGVEIVSHTEPHATQSAMVRQILAAVAEQQTRDIAANVRRAAHERGRRGLHVGPKPYGYVTNPLGADHPIVPGPPEAVATVRRAFELAASGLPRLAICRALDAEGRVTATGQRRWHHATVTAMIRNPTYRGVQSAAGTVTERAHEPLVDDATWHAAQSVSGRRAPRVKRVSSWLEGSVWHDCGLPMHFNQPSPHRPRPSFRCRGGNGMVVPACTVRPIIVDAARLERQSWALLRDALLAVLPAERVVAEATRRLRSEDPALRRRRREAERELAEIAARRERADEAYLKGLRDAAWLAAEEARIVEREAAARAHLADLPVVPNLAGLRAAETSLRSLAAVVDQISESDRGRVLRAVGRIVVGPGGRVRSHGPEGVPRLVPHPDLAPLIPRSDP